MKFLLSFQLTLITFFSQAQHTNSLVNYEDGSTMNMSCMFIIGFICLAIAATAFYMVANKRRGIDKTSHPEKNT
jgi:hypothetical protein